MAEAGCKQSQLTSRLEPKRCHHQMHDSITKLNGFGWAGPPQTLAQSFPPATFGGQEGVMTSTVDYGSGEGTLS